MSIHVSIGLAQSGTAEKPEKAIRLGVCKFTGQEDTEALLSISDARMIAALLITAADELTKQLVTPLPPGTVVVKEGHEQ